jgi:hypothetical protein
MCRYIDILLTALCVASIVIITMATKEKITPFISSGGRVESVTDYAEEMTIDLNDKFQIYSGYFNAAAKQKNIYLMSYMNSKIREINKRYPTYIDAKAACKKLDSLGF